jgi:hypothetical protein
MNKKQDYDVSWDGAQGIRVKAASFLGAMRAAFGPALYKEVETLNEHQRRIKWPEQSAEAFFIVTLHLD